MILSITNYNSYYTIRMSIVTPRTNYPRSNLNHEIPLLSLENHDKYEVRICFISNCINLISYINQNKKIKYFFELFKKYYLF